MEPRVEPVVLSTDSLSVILERKEGNGWKAEVTRKEVCTNCTLITNIPLMYVETMYNCLL